MSTQQLPKKNFYSTSKRSYTQRNTNKSNKKRNFQNLNQPQSLMENNYNVDDSVKFEKQRLKSKKH